MIQSATDIEAWIPQNCRLPPTAGSGTRGKQQPVLAGR